MLDGLRDALGSGGLLALPAALLGGCIAGLNPCCMPMYPAAAATCCAARVVCGPGAMARWSTGAAVSFVLGLALATTILGVIAAAAGNRLSSFGGLLSYVVAFVPLLAGAHFLGLITLPTARLPTIGTRTGGAFAAGFLLSLVIAPCGTPMLASILSYAAYEGSLPYGGLLLFVYGLGAGIPILLLGLGAARVAARLDRSGLRVWVNRATGAILVAMGFYLIWRA
jgi:cytochrome c-type biogenesis protein